jgi:hypothetical protein
MARTKYTFEKRQKEIAKKQKKEEKAARRADAKQRGVDPDTGLPLDAPDGSAAEESPSAPAQGEGEEPR